MNNSPSDSEALKVLHREDKDKIRKDEVLEALRSDVWKTCISILEDIDKKRQGEGKRAVDMDICHSYFIEISEILYSFFHSGIADMHYESELPDEEKTQVTRSTHYFDQIPPSENIVFRFTKGGKGMKS